MTSDRIKEELSWLRVVFQLAVAIDAGLVAYLVQPSTSRTMAVITAFALSIGAGVTVGLIVKVYQLLHALEEARHDVP